jgi:succinylglutamate desuccinylase
MLPDTTNQPSDHIIRFFEGNPANKLIVIGGIHGNEKAGIQAIENILTPLEKYFLPDKGSLYFLKGNLPALIKGERFIEKDLNRLWKNDIIHRKENRYADEIPLKNLHSLIIERICNNETEGCTFIDLHTFSAKSGIFCIPADNESSIEMARSFKVPFIEKLASNLPGTTLEYFGNKGMTCVVFEGGTHGTVLAVKNLEYALWHALAYKGVISEELMQVRESRKYLSILSQQYPHHLELVYRHQLDAYQNFQMREGYYNFKPVKKSELLAMQEDQAINSPSDGYILMPLYQKKGSDGFFIVSDKK